MASHVCYVFYGFSGSLRKPTPKFPSGPDFDDSHKLVADTLVQSLKRLFASDDVRSFQSWTKNEIVDKLLAAPQPIRQIHVVSHGSPDGLSLAYWFDGGARLLARARRFNALAARGMPYIPDQMNRDRAAILALRDEDALLSGTFSRGLEDTTLQAIRAKHGRDASWQLWGCYSGYPLAVFGQSGPPELRTYFARFNFGGPQVDGVAVDIAKSLGVTCTAAIGKGGTTKWYYDSRRRALRRVPSNRRVPRPYWLWNERNSTWVSYDSGGNRLPRPLILGKARDPHELGDGKGGPPPKWLTDLYWRAP